MIWFFRFLLGTLGLFWISALIRGIRSKRDDRFRADPDTPGANPLTSVGVVVPARNEERNIGACVDSVLGQDHANLSLVVLNDGSEDRTGDILAARSEDPRITVLDGGDGPLPEGWLGKAWACQRGAKVLLESDNPPEWLLFVDADVTLHAHAVSGSLGHAERGQLAMVSGLGRLVMESFWEKVLQPVMAGLIMAGNDLDKVNDPENNDDRPLANGQFILVRTDAYLSVHGHAAVRTDVLDDVGMASAIKGAGHPYNLIFMRDLFDCRMYTNLSELWEGWTKNMYAGMRYSWVNLLIVMAFVTWISLAPYLLLGFGLATGSVEWMAWGAGISTLIQMVRLWLDIQVGQDARYGPTQPFAVVMLLVLLAHSGLRALRGTAEWKGRQVPIVKYGAQETGAGKDST
jgi:chlorobactene glucosyltransferase